MAQFEKREFPEINRMSYEVTDDYGHTAQLSPIQAYELLQWLYSQRDGLRTQAHPDLARQELPTWAQPESRKSARTEPRPETHHTETAHEA